MFCSGRLGSYGLMHSNLPLHVLAVDRDHTSERVDAVDAHRT
jgi:hypothetical protein